MIQVISGGFSLAKAAKLPKLKLLPNLIKSASTPRCYFTFTTILSYVFKYSS